MFKSAYLNKVYEQAAARSADEKEFLQAVKEVLESLEPVIEANPKYEANGILERMVEPERLISGSTIFLREWLSLKDLFLSEFLG